MRNFPRVRDTLQIGVVVLRAGVVPAQAVAGGVRVVMAMRFYMGKADRWMAGSRHAGMNVVRCGDDMMRMLCMGLRGIGLQAGKGQKRHPKEPEFSPTNTLIGVSCANRHFVSLIPSMPHSRIRYVNWLRVDCALRNTNLRQNCHSMANSSLCAR